MVKIEGLDELTRDLADAQKALSAIDGELGSVSFDPHDPGSIDAAIQEVERLVDEQLGAYAANALVGPIAQSMKAQYRQAIIDQAAAARVGEDKSSGD